MCGADFMAIYPIVVKTLKATKYQFHGDAGREGSRIHPAGTTNVYQISTKYVPTSDISVWTKMTDITIPRAIIIKIIKMAHHITFDLRSTQLHLCSDTTGSGRRILH